MTDTLDNGIKLPAKGSRDWYSDASSNAHLIDEHLGDTDVHLSDDDRTAISSISSKANSSDVYTKTEVDTSLSSKANASDLTTHTSNSDIHVTSTDKSTWNGKQSALSTAQLNACNSGITSTKVSGYDTHVANTDVHVTTSDKSTWNAKQNSLTDAQLSACNSGITSDKVATYDGYASSKANDSDVVHTSGDETIGGVKAFNYISDVLASDTTYGTFGDVNDPVLSQKANLTVSSWNSIGFYSKYSSNYSIGFDLRSGNIVGNNLGTSSNKWKTINGINPGALSLPNTSQSAMVQIDTTSWVLDGETDIVYIPLIDGYLTLANNKNLDWVKGQIVNDINFGIYRFTYKFDSNLGGIQGFTIPCIKGKKVIMKIKGSGFYNALFIACQGNV